MFKDNEKNFYQMNSTFLKKSSVCGIELVRHLKNIKYQSTILNSSALLNYLHNKSILSKIDEVHAYQTSQKEIEHQNSRSIINCLLTL